MILSLVKEHFAPGTELAREKKLFETILNSKTKSAPEAEAILSEVLEEAKLIKEKPLDREKVILVNKIIDQIGKEIFSLPVKEYKLLASAQILFNEVRNNFKYSKPSERVKIKKTLVENFMKLPPKEEIGEVDNLTNKILIEKFNKKYSPIMNQDQKQVLSAWIEYLLTEDNGKISEIINEKRDQARISLQASLLSEKHEMSDYKDMLEESIDKLSRSVKKVDEDIIYETIRYFDLVEDLQEINHETESEG